MVSPEEGQAATRRVLEQLESLDLIRMSSLSCEAIRPADPDVTLTLLTSLNVSGAVADDGPFVMTTSRYEVAAIDDDEEEASEANTVWRVATEVCAHWQLKEDYRPSKFDVQCFALGQGSMTCHPYAREIIQSATARMNYTPATMELLFSPWLSGQSVDIDVD